MWGKDVRQRLDAHGILIQGHVLAIPRSCWGKTGKTAYIYYGRQKGSNGCEEPMAHEDNQEILLGQGPSLAHEGHLAVNGRTVVLPWSRIA